jgi:hypothetical protein
MNPIDHTTKHPRQALVTVRFCLFKSAPMEMPLKSFDRGSRPNFKPDLHYLAHA